MSAVLLFIAGVVLISGWWLAQQRLHAKPWLEEGIAGQFPGGESLSMPAAKIGLGVFLAVVGSLFALLIAAYGMRAAAADWRQLPLPALLWFNTVVLIIGSAALHWAQLSSRVDHLKLENVQIGLLAALVTGIAFLVGQLLAWQQLISAGFILAGNPSNGFFYMITALHGLHILGGLYVLQRTTTRAWRGETGLRLHLSVELSAMYWHFLLLVWLILLGLLTGWTDDFIRICQQILS